MTTSVDITDYIAGDSREIDFTIQLDDGSVFPDLADCTISWKLSQSAPLGPGAILLEKHLGSGVTIISAPDGTIKVVIASDEIPALGCLFHSLTVTTAGGDQYTVAKGEFTAQAALT